MGQFSSSHHRPGSLPHLNHEISRSSRSFRCRQRRARSRGRSLVLLHPWSRSIPSIHLRIRVPILPIRLQLCSSCPHRCKTIHLLRQQWWSRPYCQETRSRSRSKRLVWIWIRIQTILGIRIQICLLSSILIWIPWILLRKIDCCNTSTGCGYLKIRQKPSTKCQNKQTYIYPELSVKQKYL